MKKFAPREGIRNNYYWHAYVPSTIFRSTRNLNTTAVYGINHVSSSTSDSSGELVHRISSDKNKKPKKRP